MGAGEHVEHAHGEVGCAGEAFRMLQRGAGDDAVGVGQRVPIGGEAGVEVFVHPQALAEEIDREIDDGRGLIWREAGAAHEEIVDGSRRLSREDNFDQALPRRGEQQRPR